MDVILSTKGKLTGMYIKISSVYIYIYIYIYIYFYYFIFIILLFVASLRLRNWSQVFLLMFAAKRHFSRKL